MDWIILIAAGLLEAVWANTLKFTDGFTRPVPSLITLASLAASFILLAQAVRTLPISIAYTVWTGVGVVGTAIVGSLFFDEPRDLPRVFCIGLIVLGIVGLRFVGSK